jgi:hypothetical protein
MSRNDGPYFLGNFTVAFASDASIKNNLIWTILTAFVLLVFSFL